jgi:ADP-ribose pyrophosphatase
MSKNYVYKDNWIKVRIDDFEDDGEKKKYTVLERQEAVVIIPLTPSDKTVLLSEYRYPVNSLCLGLPMGFIDDGESENDAAKRELKEEIGIEAEVVKIGFFHSAPGLTPQKVAVFIARVSEEELANSEIDQSENNIKGKSISTIEEFEEKIKAGEITDGFTLSSFAVFKANSKA